MKKLVLITILIFCSAVGSAIADSQKLIASPAKQHIQPCPMTFPHAPHVTNLTCGQTEYQKKSSWEICNILQLSYDDETRTVTYSIPENPAREFELIYECVSKPGDIGLNTVK